MNLTSLILTFWGRSGSAFPRERTMENSDTERKGIPAVLWAVAITSCAGLLVCVLRWQLVAFLTLFVEPFIEISIFFLFGVALLWAAIHALRPHRGSWPNQFGPGDPSPNRLGPLALGLAALAVFLFFPFTQTYLKIDFARHLQARTAAAEQVIRSRGSGPVMKNSDGELIPMPGLSEDGEAIYVHTAEKQMVFFFTFRGILAHFSGFVYSETDAAPEKNDFGGDIIEVEHLRKHWYWVTSV
jgi:hypothetical protein